MELKEWVNVNAEFLSALPIGQQRYFASVWAKYLCSQKEEDTIFDIIDEMLKKTDRFGKIKRWIDRRFVKHYEYTPLRVAAEAVKYFRINSKMMPYLIKTSQRIKNRVRQREGFSLNK
jgi:23S rRNA A1618 N6-methylase RlmF